MSNAHKKNNLETSSGTCAYKFTLAAQTLIKNSRSVNSGTRISRDTLHRDSPFRIRMTKCNFAYCVRLAFWHSEFSRTIFVMCVTDCRKANDTSLLFHPSFILLLPAQLCLTLFYSTFISMHWELFSCIGIQ